MNIEHIKVNLKNNPAIANINNKYAANLLACLNSQNLLNNIDTKNLSIEILEIDLKLNEIKSKSGNEAILNFYHSDRNEIFSDYHKDILIKPFRSIKDATANKKLKYENFNIKKNLDKYDLDYNKFDNFFETFRENDNNFFNSKALNFFSHCE